MSGNGRKKFTWFEKMDHILGPRPSQPNYLVQSGREDHQTFMQLIEGEDSQKENLEGILYRSKYAIT